MGMTQHEHKRSLAYFLVGFFISGVNLIMTRMSTKDEQDNQGNLDTPLLTDPPFYLPEFEKSYRYIIDEYEVPPKEIAIFMPCAVKKPYSSSPSHQLIRMIISQVLDPSLYHIVIFGTCGIVPAELETMYPYAHYKYMLGRCNDDKIKDDFLRIETDRVAGYLNKTRSVYKYRIGYCIGLFREALVRGSEQSGVPIDLLLPTRDIINKVIEEGDCTFQEGSLSMEEYLGEFCDALIKFRNERLGRK
jgi:archaeosine synthase alpha-subunit